jgi:hypothetical protein
LGPFRPILSIGASSTRPTYNTPEPWKDPLVAAMFAERNAPAAVERALRSDTAFASWPNVCSKQAVTMAR